MAARPFAHGLPVDGLDRGLRPRAAGDADTLIERADQALYWAKAHGRDAALRGRPRPRPAPPARGRRGAGRRAHRRARPPRRRGRPDARPGPRRRVADLSVALAARLDWSPRRQARLHRAARVHDAGKALLSTDLLSRPAPLTTPRPPTCASTPPSGRPRRRRPRSRAGALGPPPPRALGRRRLPRRPGRPRHPRRRADPRARRRLGRDDDRPPVPRALSADEALARSTGSAARQFMPDAAAAAARRAAVVGGRLTRPTAGAR